MKKENKAIKDIILRDIRNLFDDDEAETYYNAIRVTIFGITIILNMKVMLIETKHYQLKNILRKLDHI